MYQIDFETYIDIDIGQIEGKVVSMLVGSTRPLFTTYPWCHGKKNIWLVMVSPEKYVVVEKNIFRAYYVFLTYSLDLSSQ